MPTLSTDRKQRSSIAYVLVIIAFSLTTVSILAYLYTPSLPAGDAAVYLEQVQQGVFRERTVHLGYLLQLWASQALAGVHGPPLLSVIWGVLGLAGAAWAGAALVTDRRLAAVPPLLLLGMAPFWQHTLFAEVYGPAAASLSIGAALALHGRWMLSACAVSLACLMHPGSLVWVPPLVWLAAAVRPPARPRPAPGTRVPYAALALLPTAAVAALFAGDFVMGERGVAALIDWPNPWGGAQIAYGVGGGAIRVTGRLLVLGVGRRAGGPLGLAVGVGLAAAICMDWRDDVPAALPALYLAAPLAAPGLAVALERLGPPRVIAAVALALLVFQIGEGTTHQDRARRQVDREVAAIRALASDAPPLPTGSFGERRRYLHYAPTAAGPRHVQLPLGTPFGTAACPGQEAHQVEKMQVFVCGRAPAEPSSAADETQPKEGR